MGIAERRKREREKRKNDILDAAEAVFFTKGFDQATMDDVAERAELSKGTLYLYFRNKQLLNIGLTLRALQKLHEIFDRAVKRANTGIGKIRAIGEGYYHYATQHADYFKTIKQYEIANLQLMTDEPLLRECHAIGQRVRQIVVDAIKAGMKDGTIRNDLNPVKIGLILEGQLTGLIQLLMREKMLLLHDDLYTHEELINTYYDFVFSALTPKR
jgi:TetR/AcrR family transcriptional regulator